MSTEPGGFDEDPEVGSDEPASGPDHGAGARSGGGAQPGEDAVNRGFEAMQAAAEELIGAARAMLDVADELVHNPDAADTVVTAFASVARAASRFGVRGERARPAEGRDDDGDGGVRRIPVS